MTTSSCGVWTRYKRQARAKGSGRDQAEEFGFPPRWMLQTLGWQEENTPGTAEPGSLGSAVNSAARCRATPERAEGRSEIRISMVFVFVFLKDSNHSNHPHPKLHLRAHTTLPGASTHSLLGALDT